MIRWLLFFVLAAPFVRGYASTRVYLLCTCFWCKLFLHQIPLLTQPGIELAALELQDCSTDHQAPNVIRLFESNATMLMKTL